MNGPEMYREDRQNFFLKLTILKKKKNLISWKKNIVLKKNIIWEFSYVYEKQCSEVFHESLVW